MLDLPIDPAAVAPFLLAVALIELTPGPNMGFLAVVSAARGRAAGLAVVAGVTLGLAIYMVAAAVGVTEALLVWRPGYEILRWAGVLYLLWLAYETWRGEGETSPGHARLEQDHAGLFARGLLANLLNPKAALFYVALLPGFVDPARGAPLTQALIFGGGHLAVSVLVHGAIVILAARAARMLGAAERSPRLRALFAGALAVTALWMAWETRL